MYKSVEIKEPKGKDLDSIYEEMLKDESIWLCTICGFIYIGKNPPELCPVCKVPSYKFEKVEGGR